MPNPNSKADCENLDTLPAKCATLQFFDASDPKWATEKPFYSNIPFTQTKIANTNVINTSARVQISDIRGHESDFTLDKNGFQLVNWKHKFSDVGPSFQEEGYPAVVKFMKEVLGSHVKVRQSQPRGSAPEDEKGYIGRPSKVAHNVSGNPSNPSANTPSPSVITAHVMKGTVIEVIWSTPTFDQSDEEVWLIKTMDSLARTEDVAMYTPHTSFFDEDPAVAEEIRESIELRVYVIG
ncbi:hypothetical protein BFJ72_g12582 [Fusarium proliferatum]|uniref:Uncharacterized protein n=1 Tax=Gibberella intermedia TaxID=948311 RepID=A0A420SGE7_GIBIN|nr:hypothetical protein BFJ72_g12582 [Fusarium proliferatum]